MIKNTVISLILILLLLAITLSACSGSDNSDASSVNTPLSDDSSHTQFEQSEKDAASSASQGDGEDNEEDAESHDAQMVRIDAEGGLRMRDGPGMDYEIIQVIPQYQSVRLANEEDARPDWVYVYYNGEYGWISTEYISYESDTAPTSDWASVYYDYLSTFEAVTYTSTLYGSQHIVSGHVVEGEMRGCNLIEFWDVEGYDYPVLMSNEVFIDASGNVDGPVFSPTIYLVEDGEVVEIGEANRSTFFKASDDGPGFDMIGNKVIGFMLKPENGGGPENVQNALAWLKAQ